MPNPPKIETLKRIADALNVPCNSLVFPNYEGTLAHHINDAVEEAVRQNIEVNCVLINQSLAYSKQIPPVMDSTGIIGLPDCVLGLPVIYTMELLPHNANFMLTRASSLPPTKDAEIERLKAENEELKDKLRRIIEFCEDWAEEATQNESI